MLQHLITWAFQLSILATAFGFGLKATTEDVQDLIRRPALLGRSLLAIFVIVPIVAVALAHAFDFPHAAEIAMIALAISPLAALVPVNLIKVGRSFSFPAGLMAMVALLSVAVVPLLVALVGRFLGWSSLVSPLRAAGVVAVIVLLPLVAGMVVRALRPVLADRIELPASLAGTVVLRLATLALLLTSLHAIWALIVNGTVIAIAVVVVVGFAAGHVLGGPHPNGRTVLATLPSPFTAAASQADDVAEQYSTIAAAKCGSDARILISSTAPSCNSPPIHKTAGFVLPSREGQFPLGNFSGGGMEAGVTSANRGSSAPHLL